MGLEEMREKIREQKDFINFISENRYDFKVLAYKIFCFGKRDHKLEQEDLHPWQIEELERLSYHLKNPDTRFKVYKRFYPDNLGGGKTSFMAIVAICLMYTQRLKGYVCSNIKTQLDICWSEYKRWMSRAKYSDVFFQVMKCGIYNVDRDYQVDSRFEPRLLDNRIPQAISGIQNRGGCNIIVFEEAETIPDEMWEYVQGVFIDEKTIKIHLSAGTTSEPGTYFKKAIADQAESM